MNEEDFCGYTDWRSTYIATPGVKNAGYQVALDSFDDEELVFEMLKRGYAVAKMDVQDMAEAMK